MKVNDQIDSHYGLFVNYVAQAGEEELHVLFSEAKVDSSVSKEISFNEGTENEVSLTGLNPIVSDEFSRKYKAIFKRFLIYQVIGESCIAWDESEVFEGRLIRTFSKSRFLEHVDSHMIIEWYMDVPDMRYAHYQICGLDFLVDVVAQEPPDIKEVEEFFLK